MTTKITTKDTYSGILNSITAVLPAFFTRKEDSGVYNFILAIAQVFKINIDQINQCFNNTFISQSSGTVLDGLITDISNIHRKNDEVDEDYVNRYYKYIFDYNIQKNTVREIVYDILNEYPIKLVEGNQRTAYWGQGDLTLEEQVAASGDVYYYDDDNPDYLTLWGGEQGDRGFIGYIYLNEKPTQDKLDELCNVIELVRARGTSIYLVWPPVIYAPTVEETTEITDDSFIANWLAVDDASGYAIDVSTDEDFSTFVGDYENYDVGNVLTFEITGLDPNTTYYYRIRAYQEIT